MPLKKNVSGGKSLGAAATDTLIPTMRPDIQHYFVRLRIMLIVLYSEKFHHFAVVGWAAGKTVRMTFTVSAGYGSLVVPHFMRSIDYCGIWPLAYIEIHASNSTDSLCSINHCLFNFRWLTRLLWWYAHATMNLLLRLTDYNDDLMCHYFAS